MLAEVTHKNFKSVVQESRIPVIIDAYAPWCSPCNSMAPIFEDMAAEFKGIYKFVKINVDEEHDWAVEYKIASIPTLVFMKDGHEIGRTSGFQDEDAIKDAIKKIFG